MNSDEHLVYKYDDYTDNTDMNTTKLSKEIRYLWAIRYRLNHHQCLISEVEQSVINTRQSTAKAEPVNGNWREVLCQSRNYKYYPRPNKCDIQLCVAILVRDTILGMHTRVQHINAYLRHTHM